ncbi:hepatic sodium/bile acid cotransporter-like [Pholidichthys leucotaenia]
MNVTEVYERMIKSSVNGSMDHMKIKGPINHTINILSIIILFTTMVSLGCTMEIRKIRAHLFKPKGTAIALAAQFGIMPITAFTLAKLLKMDSIKAVAVLICGCCPGGNLSNVFSLLLKGDMNLSIVMTTCSSVTALGMMPLLLYIFSQGFTSLEKAVPYLGIIVALVSTLVPCAIGITFNHYRPHFASVFKKVGLAVLLIMSIAMCILSGYLVKDIIWMILMPDVIAVAVLMPLIGFTLGYVLSTSCGLSPKCCRTVSMETGCQNMQLCTTILKVAFPLEVVGPLFLFPLLYIAFQCAEAAVIILCFRCYHRVNPQAEETSGHSGGVKPVEVRVISASDCTAAKALMKR